MRILFFLSTLMFFSVGLSAQTITVENNTGCDITFVIGCGTTCDDESCEVGPTTLSPSDPPTDYTAPCTWTSSHKWIYIKYYKAGIYPPTGGVDNRINGCGPGDQSYNCSGNIVVTWTSLSSVVLSY
jgi:hypothetical protein